MILFPYYDILFEVIKRMYSQQMTAKEFSPASLAYLGDSVIELMVRSRLVMSKISDAGMLNSLSRDYVSAVSQSNAMEKIFDKLSEDEMTFFKWGRNMHTNVPKSASVAQYRRATGMETLFAALFIEGKHERLKELFNLAFEADNIENSEEQNENF